MSATAPARLDRAGRILIRVGGLIAVVFAALPAFLFALFSLAFADSSTSDEAQTLVAALMVFAIAVVVTVAMMLRGSTAWLALGGIGSLVAGCIALALVYRQGNEWFVFVGQAAFVAASALVLALGAGMRLITRRTEPGGW